jgi:hypothetical protein
MNARELFKAGLARFVLAMMLPRSRHFVHLGTVMTCRPRRGHTVRGGGGRCACGVPPRRRSRSARSSRSVAASSTRSSTRLGWVRSDSSRRAAIRSGQADADADGTGDACDPTPYGTTPPTIVIPAHVIVNATSPSGTPVPYTLTVTDDLPPAPDPVCAPSAGSVFAIGRYLGHVHGDGPRGQHGNRELRRDGERSRQPAR